MHGLYLLWWVQEKRVPPALVAATLATGDVVLAALEVPTGWFADRFGHRVSLMVGSVAQVAGILVFWLGQGASGLLLATLLVALGDAFRSGADQALLYRSCVALGREAAFRKIEATTRAIELVALVGLILAGGAIVEVWGFGIGWLIETVVCATGLTIALAMVEPPGSDDEPASEATTRHVGAGTCAVRERSRSVSEKQEHAPGKVSDLIPLIVPASLLGSAASAALFLAQTAGGSNPARLSMLVAIVTCAEAAGSMLAAHLAAGSRSQIGLASLGAIVTMAAFTLPAAFTPAVVALSFLFGVAYPLRAAAIQRLAADRMRARAASTASAFDKAFGSAGLLGAGLLPRRR
jgi:hypothetical protein